MDKQQFAEMLEKDKTYLDWAYGYGVIEAILSESGPKTPAKKMSEMKAFMEVFEAKMRDLYPLS